MVNPELFIVVPLGLAFAIPLLKYISKKIIRFVPALAFLFNLIFALRLIPVVMDHQVHVQIGGFIPPLGINLVAGPVGMLFVVLIALVGFLVSIYAFHPIKEKDEDRYHILYMLQLTGATGVVLTGDIFNLFVFFEILCLASYSLVAYLGNRAGIESAVKYLIQGSLGSGLILIGIGLLYGQFGTLNMADIAGRIHSVQSISVYVPLVLFITGFGVEAALFPLNAWLPDAHSSAPSTISAVLSGIAIEVGLYAVLRVVFTLFGITHMMGLFLLLGVLTLLIGELCAFSQDNIKRMLAFSSIGQIGLLVFAFSLASTLGIAGGFFQLISHTLGKALLFLAAGYMIAHTGSMEIASFQGMGKRMPFTSLAFTIGAFSMVGLPPFMGFPGKFMILKAALHDGQMLTLILLVFILIATVIEGAYFFRVVQVLYFAGEDLPDRERAPVAFSRFVPMFLFTGLIIVLGIYPSLITDLLDASALELLDRPDFIKSIIP